MQNSIKEVHLDGHINNLETSLRNLANKVLTDKLGENYLSTPKFSKYKKQWEKYKLQDAERRPAGFKENRLIYFSSLTELKNIILNNWNEFKDIFKNQQKVNVMLTEIIAIRDPLSHRRPLKQTEKTKAHIYIIEIMQMINNFWREKYKVGHFEFPVIEEIVDSLGNRNTNSWAKGKGGDWSHLVQPIVISGDIISFVIYARSPRNEKLQYSFQVHGTGGGSRNMQSWGNENKWTWNVSDIDVGLHTLVLLAVKGEKRPYALGEYDDYTYATYKVLPKKE